jgi:hypothetical protein
MGSLLVHIVALAEPANDDEGPASRIDPACTLMQRNCGPLFYVVLAPGAYRVKATCAGVTLTKTFRVGKSATIGTFYWPFQPD